MGKVFSGSTWEEWEQWGAQKGHGEGVWTAEALSLGCVCGGIF